MKRSRDSREAKSTQSIPDTPGARRLLAAATAAFAQRGYDGASLRSIAKEAGADPALVVHSYGSKAKLWQACVDTVANGLIAALEGADRPRSLSEAVDRLLDVVCAEPVSIQFILSEIVRQDERFDYVFDRLVGPIHDLMHGSRTDGDALDSRGEIRLLAISGAIATTVVSRNFMIRKGLLADDLPAFRQDLRLAVGLLSQPEIEASCRDQRANALTTREMSNGA